MVLIQVIIFVVEMVEKIATNSLPVGVVSKLKMVSYEMPLKNNDLIIMSSDGTGNDFESDR